MRYHPDIHHRRSTRLAGYDYRTPGAYFVTICTYERRLLFGAITDGEMRRSEFGRIVAEEWRRSADIRSEVELDVFVVMPNHLHGIVWLRPPVGTQGLASLRIDMPNAFAVLPRSLSSMVRGFKSAAKIRINEMRGTPGAPVWQGRFHDRIVRNERELEYARQYIRDNPRRWSEDKHNPDGVAVGHA